MALRTSAPKSDNDSVTWKFYASAIHRSSILDPEPIVFDCNIGCAHRSLTRFRCADVAMPYFVAGLTQHGNIPRRYPVMLTQCEFGGWHFQSSMAPKSGCRHCPLTQSVPCHIPGGSQGTLFPNKRCCLGSGGRNVTKHRTRRKP